MRGFRGYRRNERGEEYSMPGYVLHLTAARMFLDRLSGEHPFCKDKILMNDFYIGNLLPDTVKDKSRSHFRDPMFWESESTGSTWMRLCTRGSGFICM